MGKPTYTAYWRKPLYDSEQALERAQQASFRTNAGRMNAGMDLLGVANEMAEMRKTYRDVAIGIEQKKILDNIREQLSPDQRVRVVIDHKTNQVTSIERPGGGYFPDTSGKLDYFPLQGDDDGICRGNPVPERTEFTVQEGDHRKTLMLFDERRPPHRDRSDEEKPEKAHRENYKSEVP